MICIYFIGNMTVFTLNCTKFSVISNTQKLILSNVSVYLQVMCDEIFTQNQAECGLKIVAACNPYRK